MSEPRLVPPQRNTLAAATLAVFAGSYMVLGLWYFYIDFFRFLMPGAPTLLDGSGYAVQVDCYRWTVLSPWRLLGFAITAVLLGQSAVKLWRNRPGARALTLFTLWGLALPQLFWFTELAVDWNHAHGVSLIVLSAATLVMLPTALLYEGAETLSSWTQIAGNRGRVLLTSIAAAWIAFGASEFIDHSYQLDSSMAYGSATAAIILGGLAAAGLLRARVWGLLAAIAASASLMVVPLAFTWAPYMPTGGFIDGFVIMTAGSPLQSAATALVPLALIGAASAPLLRNLAKRLSADSEQRD